MKIKYLTLYVFSMLVLISCADNTNDNIPSNVIYLVNSATGGKEINLYTTGTNDTINIPVYRSGKFGNKVTASIQVLNADELAAYNKDNGTSYVLLPNTVFSVLNSQVQFSADNEDVLQYVKVLINPTDLKALKMTNPNVKYVIPVKLKDASAEINTSKQYSFVVPSASDPLVYLGVSGIASAISYASTDSYSSISLVFPLNVDFKNYWDINCAIEADQKLVDEFNAANGAYYVPLPASTYTLDNNVLIKSGSSNAYARLNVDGTKLTYGNYLLAVKLKSVSKFGINSTKSTYLLPILLEAPLLDRTGWSIADCTPVAAEGPVANVLDGNVLTYYHNQWSPNVPELPHYVVVDMKEKKWITQVDLVQRQTATTAYADLKNGNFYVTDDDVNAMVAAGTADAINWIKIGSYTMDKLFTAQKFGVKKSQTRFLKIENTVSGRNGQSAFSEVYVHGSK